MATGALDANGIWLYGEDDSEPTASALLNKLGNSISDKFDGGLPVANGGTGATTVAGAQDSLGVGLIPLIPSSVTYVGGTGTTGALGTLNITNCTSVEINGVFSSAYTNYKVIYRGTASAHGQPAFIRFRTGTTDTSVNYYSGGYQGSMTSSVLGSYYTGSSSIGSIGNSSIDSFSTSFELTAPNVAARTQFMYTTSGNNGTTYLTWSGAGFMYTTTQYTGLQFGLTAGTLSGTLTVYGYND